jgi:HAD superfamily hydrolase (TIGR01509 family)
MLPEALLLDLDGTLIDSEQAHTRSIVQYFVRRGIELSDDEQAYVVGHAWQEIYEYLDVHARVGLSLTELQVEAVRFKEGQMSRGELEMPVLPGAAELVERVHEVGVPIAIVSGSCRAEIEQVLPRLGIGSRLRFFMGAEDYPRGKPAPDGYLAAASRLVAQPTRCLVVEDSEAGIASARAARMRVVATSAANAPKGSLAHQSQHDAHRIVDGLDAIDLDFIRSLMQME